MWYFCSLCHLNHLMMLSFIEFRVKLIHVDGRSKSLAVILNFWILHGSVATHLRRNGTPCNSYVYIELPWESVNCRILTRGSAIADRPARRSVSAEILAWGALLATATFYSAIYIVLYAHSCTRHNYRTASMQCRACYQQTSVKPVLVISTGP